MKRRYISNRERTALFGIGTHRKELIEFIADKLKKDGFNVSPENIKINNSDTILDAGNKKFQIFKNKNEYKKTIESEYINIWKEYLKDLEYKKKIYGIYDFGINKLNNVLNNMVEDTIINSIHIVFDKNTMNKFKFGSNEFYLREI